MTKSKILYEDIQFPSLPSRPFFYTNFVSTIDGKVQVTTSPDYWPIGSGYDYQVFTQLRVPADIIVHGKNTALGFIDRTIQSIHNENFLKKRKAKRKAKIQYAIVCNNIDPILLQKVKNEYGFKPLLILPETADVPVEAKTLFEVIRCGEKKIEISVFSEYLFKQRYKTVLIEGGPVLLGSFLKEDLIDEIFLTISPKIFGNEKDSTLTMVEGSLFAPDRIKQFQLISATPVENEVYVHYKIIRK